MTCIVGIVAGNRVIIAGDSAAVDHRNVVSVRFDRKVFRLGDLVMGFTTSFRMGQLLAFGFTPPAPRAGQDEFAYLATDFIEAVRQRFRDGGFTQIKDAREEGGQFLVGTRGRLFEIDTDFQLGEPTCGFASVGSAYQVALGSLHATREWLAPEVRLLEALGAAMLFNACVRAPFHFESTP